MVAASQRRCPLCSSNITQEDYERVLRISEARRGELERARNELAEKRTEIERRAVEAERKRASQEAQRQQENLMTRIDHLGKELQAARKAAATERKLAEREATRREKEAQRAIESRLALTIHKLDQDLKTERERRQRDEEKWHRVVEDLQQKAASRDQAHFGPEGEEQLVELLRAMFPGDSIERRGKGGDVLQTVMDAGKACGMIVYECKRTATWQTAYVRELKRAMELHGTKYGILVSRKLPRKVSGFGVISGILVVEPHLAGQLAGIIRNSVLEVARARLSTEGRDAKIEELYEYLGSDDFGNAFSRIDDKVRELRASLETERGAHDRWWRIREQQYGAILRESTGVDARVKEIFSKTVTKSAKVHRLHA